MMNILLIALVDNMILCGKSKESFKRLIGRFGRVSKRKGLKE